MKKIAGMKGNIDKKVVTIAAVISLGGLLFGAANAILSDGNADGWRIRGGDATQAVANTGSYCGDANKAGGKGNNAEAAVADKLRACAGDR